MTRPDMAQIEADLEHQPKENTMNVISLEALGISKADLEEKLVSRLAEEFTTEVSWDEDGHAFQKPSSISKQIKAHVQAHLDAKVAQIAAEHVLPNVSEMVSNLVLQSTNQWGEKTGKPVTFIEYLTARADEYLREDVDMNGKSRAEAGGYDFRKTTNRITYLVNRHLQHSIETAMKAALAQANSSIAAGLEGAVKHALAEATTKLKVAVTTK